MHKQQFVRFVRTFTVFIIIAVLIPQFSQALTMQEILGGHDNVPSNGSVLSDVIVTAASCSQADIQNSINSASDGATVVVPNGSCTWTGYVQLSNAKGVSLV